jgi:hypothetical protein
LVELGIPVEKVANSNVLVEKLKGPLALVELGTLVEAVDCQILVEKLRRPLALVELETLVE